MRRNRQGVAKTCNQARSALTQKVIIQNVKIFIIAKYLLMAISGQLRNLGLYAWYLMGVRTGWSSISAKAFSRYRKSSKYGDKRRKKLIPIIATMMPADKTNKSVYCGVAPDNKPSRSRCMTPVKGFHVNRCR